MKFGITKLNKDEAMKKIIAFTIGSLLAGSAFAFFPPLSPEAQAAADLAKAKKAYAGTVGAYKTCMAQNKVAYQYRVAGTPEPGACTAPAPFVAAK
jgi:hypothetical protein